MLEVLYHHAKFGGARISPAAGVAKNVEFFVCLFVRHAFERQRLCARFRHEGVGVQKRLWCRWIGEGLYSCALVFNFLRLLPIGDTDFRAIWVQKYRISQLKFCNGPNYSNFALTWLQKMPEQYHYLFVSLVKLCWSVKIVVTSDDLMGLNQLHVKLEFC